MSDRNCLIALPEVTRLTQCTAAEIAGMIERGVFPTAIQIGKRLKRWDSGEVGAWIAGRDAQPDLSLSRAPMRLPKGIAINEVALVRSAPDFAGRFMSIDRIRNFAIPVADLLHSVSGIYFLWKLDRVVYVGQTRTGYHRIASHLANSGMDFDAVSFIRCSRDQLDAVEREYLDRMLPTLNSDPITEKKRRTRARRERLK